MTHIELFDRLIARFPNHEPFKGTKRYFVYTQSIKAVSQISSNLEDELPQILYCDTVGEAKKLMRKFTTEGQNL